MGRISSTTEALLTGGVVWLATLVVTLLLAWGAGLPLDELPWPRLLASATALCGAATVVAMTLAPR